jgi:hypothetical protein
LEQRSGCAAGGNRLVSVETYLLVRPLSDLAVERQGAACCPLISKPSELDLDVQAARLHAGRLRPPFVRLEPHPAALPRPMRLASMAAARGCGAIFTIRATRLARATGADLERLDGAPGLEDGDIEAGLDD